MKLLINMSEDDYKEVKKDTYSGTPFENRVFSAIANGTPLPNGGWITVSERLPKENDYCLCCDKDGYRAIGCIKNWSIRRLDGTRYCGKDWSFDDDKIDIDVIAWMPLPEPYKVESEDKQTEKSCDNCDMQYKCLGTTKRFRHFYGEYWCWKPETSTYRK